MQKRHARFSEFYPYYLSEHANRTCRRWHFVGSCLALVILFTAFVMQRWFCLIFIPVVGYGFAWIGHFYFEHNRPATFKYPYYSFLGDWVMFKDILSGRIPF